MSEMQIVRRGEPPPSAFSQSLFLAGSADAAPGGPSWRETALSHLDLRGYRGVVFLDEGGSGEQRPVTVENGRWESRSDCHLVWLEAGADGFKVALARFGELAHSRRIVLGVGDGAHEQAELRHWAAQRRIPVADTLSSTVDRALELLPPGARRVGGEREVPLLFWNARWFRGWYEAQRGAGNTLLGVERLWAYGVGAGRRRVMISGLAPRMWIAAEQRVMSCEMVIGRADMSALMLYRPACRDEETEVVFVREYRPAARTADANVWELPGGSGESQDPKLVAVLECAEETGLVIDSDRLRDHGARQVWATGAAHIVHLYSAVATATEIEYVHSHAGPPHGVHDQEEFTYPLVLTVDEVRDSEQIDWSTKGMVAQVLFDRR